MQIKEIIDYLDLRFPRETASDFDTSIGFSIGDKNVDVTKVLLALDLTLEVVNDAINKGCNLIITHHPFLFNPINKILYNTPQGKIIKLMCDKNISTYSAHTNLDVAVGGVNDSLAKMLKIDFEHTLAIKDKLLVSGPIKPCTLKELVKIVKDTFKLDGVRVIGSIDTEIKKVGIIGGSGASLAGINEAILNKCDCFITGEVHLDKGIFAKNQGLCIIEVNHGIERFVFDYLKEELKGKFGDIFIVSNINTDPLVSM